MNPNKLTCTLPCTLIFSTATFITQYLDLLEIWSKHLSILAQTISDHELCRFGGIDAIDRWYVAHHSQQLSSSTFPTGTCTALLWGFCVLRPKAYSFCCCTLAIMPEHFSEHHLRSQLHKPLRICLGSQCHTHNRLFYGSS